MRRTLIATSLLAYASAAVALAGPNTFAHFGAQGVNFHRLHAGANDAAHLVSSAKFTVQDTASGHALAVGSAQMDDPIYQEYWFEQPIDHFAKDSGTFKQRYWINTRHFNATKGGPVFVLDGGETSGKNRLPFLDTGIMDILPKATGGIGIILEHRYYGESLPVKDLSTDSLRWLNNEQAAADSANFMKNVKFAGIDGDLTAPGTPWIYYGGSYAGARAAHMRVLYPDITYGAIASSGVTWAFTEYWEYMDTIRLAADATCSADLQRAVVAIDAILTGNNKWLKHTLKGLFGVAELKHDEDFASLITHPLGYWQAKNWDDEVGSKGFDRFCAALTRPPFGRPGEDDPDDDDDDDNDNPNFEEFEGVIGQLSLPLTVINYARYIRKHVVSRCETSVEECFGTFDDAKFQDVSLDQEWRKWLFQVCTQWGYFFVAPPDPEYPRIVSRLHTLYYESKICTQAFPPGKHFTVPPMPNVTAVNSLGGFDIAADRLAIIDGEVDPWKPATPHSRYAKDRESTLSRPFLEIKGGVHHWDENGLRNPRDEPREIKKVHRQMIQFVKAWLKDWEVEKAKKN